MKESTLVFLREQEAVWLGQKKNNFWKGKWNGYGGTQLPGESLVECAVREVLEETPDVRVSPSDLELSAILYARHPQRPEHNQRITVYQAKIFSGRPTESDEMKSRLFGINALPYDEMFMVDTAWISHVLHNERLHVDVTYDAQLRVIKRPTIRPLEPYLSQHH